MSDVDFDLHGLVGVRLLDATVRDVAVVERQIGPLQAPLNRVPDILVRFVDRLPHLTSARRRVGLDAAFDDAGFYLLRGKSGASIRVMLPLHQLGSGGEIVCERGLPAVPLLVAGVNLAALGRGVLPLHASAFAFNGRGVLAAGWAKGGKTETLLAFAERGARYVADEWTYVTEDGMLYGVPEPIRLWAWQLAQLERYRAALPPRSWPRLRATDAAGSVIARLGAGISRGGRGLGKIGAMVANQAWVQVPPHELFPGQAQPCAPLDDVVLTVAMDAPGVRLRRIEGHEIAERMPASLDEERQPLMAAYRQFRFAFPELSNPLIEGAADRERKLLADLLYGRPALELTHPYPCDISGLYEVLAPALGDDSATSPSTAR